MNILTFLREPERSLMLTERLMDDHPGVRVVLASSLEEAMPHLPETDVLLTLGVHLGEVADELYRAAPRLGWVQSLGSGTDNIKDHPALAAGVAISNVHGIHGPQLSEAAFAAMLSFARGLPALVHDQDRAVWARPVPTVLDGRTVGILGLGAIASVLAPRCKAFGMVTVGISATARPVAGFDRVYARVDLPAAVAEVDYLVLLTPLTPETHHIVDAAVLAAMRPGACLINLARGGVLDETALRAALDAGQIGGAVLDVFEQEPLPAGHPLWTHPKVIVWPHTAGLHSGYPDQVYAVISENVRRYLAGGAAALVHRIQ